MKLPRLPISFVRMFSYPWVANPYLPQSCAQYGVLNSQMNGPASSVPTSRVPFSTVPARCLHPQTPVVVSGPTTIHGLPYHGLQINSGISHLSNFAAGAAAQVPAAAVQVSASVPAPTTSHAPVVVPGPPTIHGLPYHGLQINSGFSHLSNFAAGAAAQVPAAAVQVASVPAPKTSHEIGRAHV